MSLLHHFIKSFKYFLLEFFVSVICFWPGRHVAKFLTNFQPLHMKTFL